MSLPAPDRRTFLTALLAGVAGTGVVGACSSGDDGSGAPADPTTSTDPDRLPADPGLTGDPFTLGVASGDPLADSVVLWTRLATDPTAADGAGGMGADDIEVGWEIATDDAFGDIVASGIATAPAALGHSVHVAPDGLDPDGWYHYRFFIGDQAWTSPVGRTRTMPADDASPEELRFAFASCQDFGAGYYSAYRAMAADDLDLVFFLGDYIYEYATDAEGPRAVLPAEEPMTLEQYRLRYSSYRRDADLQAAHAAFPWVVTWDDHEVENNYAGLVSENDADPEEFATRRAAAYQAYYEFQPLRLDPPDGSDFRIHRSLRFGTLADLFVLDGRQYRTNQPCDADRDAFVQAGDCAELEDEDATMLGSDQETWLTEGLSESQATWKVLAQQTVMSSLVIGDLVLNVDQWDGYPAARDRLLRHIADEEISDVVVLSGDIHSAGAGEVSIDEGGTPRPVVAEFVGTSITSTTLVDSVPFDVDSLTPDAFPGMRYLNLRDHGYTRCAVTPGQWVTDYVVVESIDSADAPARVDATLSVAAGSPTMTLDA